MAVSYHDRAEDPEIWFSTTEACRINSATRCNIESCIVELLLYRSSTTAPSTLHHRSARNPLAPHLKTLCLAVECAPLYYCCV